VAKKKPKTPPPPRRVQAPRKRTTEPQFDLGARQRLILYGIAGAGIVALVVVVLIVALGGGKAEARNVGKLMTAAGCTLRTNKILVPNGQTHIPRLTGKFPWATSPPDGGAHYPLWAVWGFYSDPVNPRMVVHNMEHGGVILWWGSAVPSSTVAALQRFYNEEPVGVFGTPYPQLGSKIAITAWTGDPSHYRRGGDFGQGHLAVCSRWNAATEKAFKGFRAAYRGHGPEGIPLSLDHPGMGPR